MPPVGAPTKSFSARRETASSSSADNPRPNRSSTAVATEQTSAAEDDSPDPLGTQGGGRGAGRVDREWQHEPVVVVGVFTDQVDPTRRSPANSHAVLLQD